MTHDDWPSGGSDQDQTDSAARSMGTLVIRTWNEPDQTPGFRARLSFSQRLDDQPSTIATADPEEVLSVVRQWLFTQRGSPHQV
ncbi:MAG: hypothetical protein JWO29_1173 [Arthrobacter sp.]|nr:hypothetical protein [Arthrobacter sp.]